MDGLQRRWAFGSDAYDLTGRLRQYADSLPRSITLDGSGLPERAGRAPDFWSGARPCAVSGDRRAAFSATIRSKSKPSSCRISSLCS